MANGTPPTSDQAAAMLWLNRMLGELSASVEQLDKGLERIERLFFQGNGQPAIVSQLATIGQRLLELENKQEQMRIQRWQVIMALATGVISLLVAITTAFILSGHGMH